MIESAQKEDHMKLFRAVYRRQEEERNLDMFARDLTHATLSAKELIPTDAKLIRVFHNPDWS